MSGRAKSSPVLPDPLDEINTYSWTVIPAQPGTQIEWEAGWCEDGLVQVHAWLICIDIVGGGPDKSDLIDRSCVVGYPMILNASGELQDARFADLDGKPGKVVEP